MKHLIHRSAVSLLIIIPCLFGLTAKSAEPKVRIATYNVQNLFDSIHDAGKDDWSYLPLQAKRHNSGVQRHCASLAKKSWQRVCRELDWTPQAVSKKLDRLTLVIKKLDADVLFLQEVENLRILQQLNRKLSYPHVILIEGSDKRGIDVAILSRLPQMGQAKLLPIQYRSTDNRYKMDSRGLLHARFKLHGGKTLHAMGVHLPAPHHPAITRLSALQWISRYASSKILNTEPVVLAGDFNVPTAEEKKMQTFKKGLGEEWVSAHLNSGGAGCGGGGKSCRGTVYYPPKKEWSFFDRVILRRGPHGWRFKKGSAQVVRNVAGQAQANGAPAPFQDGLEGGREARRGASDHFPMGVTLELER